MNITHWHPIFKFDIEFEITKEKKKGTRSTNCFLAKGTVGGTIKFKAIAHFDKKSKKFTELTKIIDLFNKKWILENSIDIIPKYEAGILTLRGLHYKLVGRGMINHDRLYKRTIAVMIEARREGLVEYETFSDYERSMIGTTDYIETDVDEQISEAKRSVKIWMEYYYKNRWENQEFYVEVFIEKKTLIGVFDKVCTQNKVALGACKGYPSLTFLNETAKRFKEAGNEDKKLVIIYFGDYDPSGEDIPRSISDNLAKDFDIDVKVHRAALMGDQVVEWNLPPAPVKQGDSRSAGWDGFGQVELDAVDPEQLQELCQESIDMFFDNDSYNDLLEQAETERTKYQKEMKEFVINIKD